MKAAVNEIKEVGKLTFRPAPFNGYAEGSNNDQFGHTLTRTRVVRDAPSRRHR
jgi:hypothetical protein